MSFGSAVSAATRAVLIAAATGAAVFGLLVIVHPFGRDPGSPALVFTDTAGADALHRKIDAARQALRATEAALDKADAGSPTLAPGTDTAAQRQTRGQPAPGDDSDSAGQHPQRPLHALYEGGDRGEPCRDRLWHHCLRDGAPVSGDGIAQSPCL